MFKGNPTFRQMIVMLKIKYFTPLKEAWWKDSIFAMALILAIVIHAVILAIQFAAPEQNTSSSKEIAVSVRLSPDEVKDADFLAQADQQGSGEFQKEHRMSSDMPEFMLEQTAGDQQLAQLQKIQQQRSLTFEEKVLMTTLSWKQEAEQNQRKKAMEQMQSQYQAQNAMIASIEAQYLKRQQNFSRKQKIKTVDGIQAKKRHFRSLFRKIS